MIWLQQGDRLPTVAMVQKALRLHPDGNEDIKIDGVFGPATKRAVVALQRAKKLKDDGVVGPKTWDELSSHCRYSVVDFVDCNDDVVKRGVQSVLTALGGDPINPPFLANALELLVTKVPKHCTNGPVGLLRIFGHGNAGHQNLSKGLGGRWMQPGEACPVGTVVNFPGKGTACVYPATGGLALTPENFEEIERHLGGLKKQFADLGSVELHGCEVGSKERGQMLLFRLALFLEVPVTAAIKGNKVWTVKKVLRVESPCSTWFPWASDLTSWAKAASN